MNKKSLFILLISTLFFGCVDRSFVAFHNNFFPVSKADYNWSLNDFQSGDTIRFQLDSYNELEDYSTWEEIDKESLILTCNKDIGFNSITILKDKNIATEIKKINENLLYFEHQVADNGRDEFFYLLFLQSTEEVKLKINDDYLIFYISAKTVSGFEIKDSTMIKYEKR